MAKNKFYYDAVFCVDKSANMDNQIEIISNFVNSFYERAKGEIQNSITQVDGFRIRLITYGDLTQNSDSITDYGFFNMPEQADELYDAFDQITLEDLQEDFSSGLQAINQALDGEWKDLTGKEGRQAVVVFSLNKPHYTQEEFMQVKSNWEKGKLDKSKKMLTLFCNVAEGGWQAVERWEKTIAIHTEDFNDFSLDFILQTLLIDIV